MKQRVQQTSPSCSLFKLASLTGTTQKSDFEDLQLTIFFRLKFKFVRLDLKIDI